MIALLTMAWCWEVAGSVRSGKLSDRSGPASCRTGKCCNSKFSGGANGNVMVLVIVLAIVTVESMMTVVMLLKHGMGALHIGLETVGCLRKAIRNLFAHVCTVHTA